MPSLSSLPIHCALQELFGDAVASEDMLIPQYIRAVFYSGLVVEGLWSRMPLHGCRVKLEAKHMLYILSNYSASNELIGILCVFARCPPMIAASKLSALTMLISAKTSRLPGLIFLLVLAIQTSKDVATYMSVVITRVYNVGPSSIGGATCGVT